MGRRVSKEPACGRRVFLAAFGGKRARRPAHPEHGRGVPVVPCCSSGGRSVAVSIAVENSAGPKWFSGCAGLLARIRRAAAQRRARVVSHGSVRQQGAGLRPARFPGRLRRQAGQRARAPRARPWCFCCAVLQFRRSQCGGIDCSRELRRPEVVLWVRGPSGPHPARRRVAARASGFTCVSAPARSRPAAGAFSWPPSAASGPEGPRTQRYALPRGNPLLQPGRHAGRWANSIRICPTTGTKPKP